MYRSFLFVAASTGLVAASPLLGQPTLSVPTAPSPLTLPSNLPSSVVQSLLSLLGNVTGTQVAPTGLASGIPTVSAPPAGLPSTIIPTASVSPLSLTELGPHTVISPSLILQPKGTTPAEFASLAIPTIASVGPDASLPALSASLPSPNLPSASSPAFSGPIPAFSSFGVPSIDVPPVTVAPPAVTSATPPSFGLPSGWVPPIQVITEGPEPILIVPLAYTSQGVPQVSMSTLTLPSVSGTALTFGSVSQPVVALPSTTSVVEIVTIIPIPYSGVPIVSVMSAGVPPISQPGIGIPTASLTDIPSVSILPSATPLVGSVSPPQPTISFPGLNTTAPSPASASAPLVAPSGIIPPAGLPPITSLQTRQSSILPPSSLVGIPTVSAPSVGLPSFTAPPLFSNTSSTGNAIAPTYIIPSGSILELPSLSNIPTTLITQIPTVSQVPAILPPIPTPINPSTADISALLSNVTAASQVLAILSSNLQSNLNNFSADSILVSSLVGFATSLFSNPLFTPVPSSFGGGGPISSISPAALLANVKTAIQVIQVIINILESDAALSAVAIAGVGVTVGPQEELVGKLGGIVLSLLSY